MKALKHFTIIWTNEALKNLYGILDYIKHDSAQKSEQFGKKIAQSVSRLCLFPESGRIVPELTDQIPQPREILVGEYRIIYRILSKRIEIITMLHGKRLLLTPG